MTTRQNENYDLNEERTPHVDFSAQQRPKCPCRDESDPTLVVNGKRQRFQSEKVQETGMSSFHCSLDIVGSHFAAQENADKTAAYIKKLEGTIVRQGKTITGYKGMLSSCTTWRDAYCAF
jgi:hypothetical protein